MQLMCNLQPKLMRKSMRNVGVLVCNPYTRQDLSRTYQAFSGWASGPTTTVVLVVSACCSGQVAAVKLQRKLKRHVDARILANDSYVPTLAGATSVGKRTPYVPAWRATAVATYKPSPRWTYTLAGRYSTRLYATVDNTDVNPATYQGFEGFFVADARVRAQIDRNWSAAFGVDNLNDRHYFLFHPFPGRTFLAELKYAY